MGKDQGGKRKQYSMICLRGGSEIDKTTKFDDMSSVCSKRGNKGFNQDSLVVLEVSPFSFFPFLSLTWVKSLYYMFL